MTVNELIDALTTFRDAVPGNGDVYVDVLSEMDEVVYNPTSVDATDYMGSPCFALRVELVL